MKVVIPYKHFTGIELKFCLRGIEQFIPAADVTIIGELPIWVTNVSFIPYMDNANPEFKERNIFEKTLLVKEDFWLFNDDFYLLEPLQGCHYSGMLSKRIEGYQISNNCRLTVQNTFDLFGDIPNYYRHSPFFIERGKLESVNDLDWNKPWGYCLKSSYAHLNKIEGTDYPDLKIRHDFSIKEIGRMVQNKPYFSTGDNGMNTAMVRFLTNLYPTKSRFEK